MALTTYRQKRDFASTREPRGAARCRRGGHGFVVQKHDARRLVYAGRVGTVFNAARMLFDRCKS